MPYRQVFAPFSALIVMMVTCALLALSVTGVTADLWGPEWMSPVLFGAAALACAAVVASPDNRYIRAGSGCLVSAAFGWRAAIAILADVFQHGDRPLYSIFLYCGVAIFVSLTWHRVLPPTSAIRARIMEWQR